MATVASTTQGTPLQWPSTTLIDRHPDGWLFAMVKASTANQFDVYRSTNNGGSWSLYASTTRTNVQEIGSIFVTSDGWLHWVFRTNESSQDRIYYKRMRGDGTWFGEVLTGRPGNGGVAGAVHTGLDLWVQIVGSENYVAIAAGTQIGANQGVTLYGVRFGPSTQGTPNYNDGAVFAGVRQWLAPGSAGQMTPSIDAEHNGDGKSGGNAPALWVSWGRTDVYAVRLGWSSRWTGPTTANKVTTTALSPAQLQLAGRWTGDAFHIVAPDPTLTTQVALFIRSISNAKNDVTDVSPVHPGGVVKNCTLSYNAVTGDVRVYAVGTSNNDLYYVDRIAATGLWTSWATVTTTDILGASVNQYSVRRGSSGNARHDVLTAHSGSPNTVAHTSQTLTYAPSAPTWDTAAIGYNDGEAADVDRVLVLDWIFVDADPGDAQTAYAISRQIGVGALAYWRASDSTWQAAEVKNVSATSAITVPIGWGSGSDAVHQYKAKVWDGSDTPSNYGPSLNLVPSVKVNPTLDTPADGGTVTTDRIAMAWTVSEQVGYRVSLAPQSANSITNPFFETNATGWTGVGGTVTRSTAQFHTGAASGLITPSGVDATVDMRSNTVAVSQVGQRYIARGWIRCAVARTIIVRIRYEDGGAADVTPGSAQVSMVVAANTWTWVQVVSTVPAGAATARFETRMTGTPAAGNLLYHDEIRLIPAGLILYDSGWLAGTDRTFTPPYTVLDGQTWTVYLATRNAEGLYSDPDQNDVTIDYVDPATPTLVCVPDASVGGINVSITNPTPGGGQPALASQDLYRRVVGDTSDGVALAVGLASGAAWLDKRAVSGVPYEYRVLAKGATGASVYSAWTP